jgi:hypothetical protein
MDVDAIRAYLEARIDEDERMVLAVGDEPARTWRRSHTTGRIEDGLGLVVTYDEGSPTEEQAAYIVRHHPERVRREVAAKRRRLERHTAFIRSASGLPYCNHCSQDSYGEDWPCGDLVDDAQSWADRDDFPEELKLP